MARYSASGKTLATAAGSNVLSLRANGTRTKVEEVGIWAEAATLIHAAIFVTTAVDTGGTAVVPVKEDPGDVSPITSVLTVPTAGTGTLAATASRRAFLPAVVGAGMVWTMPGQIIVPSGLSLVLRNDGAAAGPALTWYVVWEE